VAELTEKMLDQRIDKTVLFARTTPDQKLKIVASLQRGGAVVAMTGDGVNDSLALKKADIGIVVSGASDVAKETADMVLLDDNFNTIMAAVEEGRAIYHNFLKVSLYLLSGALAEVIAIVGAMLLGWPLPLAAVQILWVNLINDGLPTLALTVDPKARGLLKLPPRPTQAPLINAYIGWLIAVVSGITGIGILIAYGYLTMIGLTQTQAQTFVFTFLSISSLTYVFSTRALRRPVWNSRILKNPWLVAAVAAGFGLQWLAVYAPPLQHVLGTAPLPASQWAAIISMSFGVLMAIELIKWGFSRAESKESKNE
jgi:Ca2+-transporting ATPase